MRGLQGFHPRLLKPQFDNFSMGYGCWNVLGNLGYSKVETENGSLYDQTYPYTCHFPDRNGVWQKVFLQFILSDLVSRLQWSLPRLPSTKQGQG